MELTSSFTGETSSQITQFQERLTSHQKAQEQMLDDLANAVTDLEVAHSQDLERLGESAKALRDLLVEWNTQFADEESKSKSFSTRAHDELSELVSKHHGSMESRLASLISLSKVHTDAVLAEAVKSKKRRHNFLEQVKNLTANSRVEMKSFLNEQSDKMLELQATIEMSIDEQTKQLTENNALLLENLNSSHSERQQQFDDLKRQLTEFFATCSKTQSERLQEQATLLEQRKLAQKNQLAQLQQVSESEIKALVESFGSFSKKNADDLERIGQRVTNLTDDDCKTTAEQVAMTRSQEQALVGWNDSVVELNSIHRTTFTDLQKHQLEQSDLLVKSKIVLQRTFSDNFKKLERTFAAGCSAIGSDIQKNAGTAKRKLSSVSAQAQTTVAESQADSAKRLEELEVFMKKRRVRTVRFAMFTICAWVSLNIGIDPSA